MQRVVIDPVHPEPRKVRFAVEHLQKGEVLAYPTDTVYGLGCDMTERGAVDRLYHIKGMREDRKLAFLFPTLAEVSQYAVLSDLAYQVCKKILPGPYTVVLPAKRWVPRALMDKRKQVGVRIPETSCCRPSWPSWGAPSRRPAPPAPRARGWATPRTCATATSTRSTSWSTAACVTPRRPR